MSASTFGSTVRRTHLSGFTRGSSVSLFSSMKAALFTIKSLVESFFIVDADALTEKKTNKAHVFQGNVTMAQKALLQFLCMENS